MTSVGRCVLENVVDEGAAVRRILVGVAFGALLAIVAAAPAGAVPPDEILIAKNLKRLGVMPSYATPPMARAAAHARA